MGDEVVLVVRNALRGVAFANGVSDGQAYVLADTVVNRLRAAGLTDEQIVGAYSEPEHPDGALFGGPAPGWAG